MDVVATLPAFVLAVLLISASPGAVPTVLGLELGLYVWALLAAAGLRRGCGGSAGQPEGGGVHDRLLPVRRRVEAVSGTVMIGLGARVASASR